MSENTYLVIRQKAKVKVFSNKPEEEKFYQSEHKQGYNISCSVEGYEINRTSASIYFRPCISYDLCQVQKLNWTFHFVKRRDKECYLR